MTPTELWGPAPTTWTRSRTDREVLALHVAVVGDCWEWTGARQKTGYGKTSRGGRMLLAHRLAYEVTLGPIADGLTVDHLCRNRSCIRPDHMDLVPMGVNTMRGTSVSAINVAKTHCVRGHPFDATNTRLDSYQHRHCRTCEREHCRQYRLRVAARTRPTTPTPGEEA